MEVWKHVPHQSRLEVLGDFAFTLCSAICLSERRGRPKCNPTICFSARHNFIISSSSGVSVPLQYLRLNRPFFLFLTPVPYTQSVEESWSEIEPGPHMRDKLQDCAVDLLQTCTWCSTREVVSVRANVLNPGATMPRSPGSWLISWHICLADSKADALRKIRWGLAAVWVAFPPSMAWHVPVTTNK